MVYNVGRRGEGSGWIRSRRRSDRARQGENFEGWPRQEDGAQNAEEIRGLGGPEVYEDRQQGHHGDFP